MTQLQGIKNFAINLKPSILKIKNGKKLLPDELNSIREFYLEVVDYTWKAERETKCKS